MTLFYSFLTEDQTSIEIAREKTIYSSLNVAASQSKSLQILITIGEAHSFKLLQLRGELRKKKSTLKSPISKQKTKAATANTKQKITLDVTRTRAHLLLQILPRGSKC
jgi:hypothetical protein